MKQAESGLDDPLESDIAFHLSILDASENRFFMQLGRIIDTTLRVSIRFTNMRTGVQVENTREFMTALLVVTRVWRLITLRHL